MYKFYSYIVILFLLPVSVFAQSRYYGHNVVVPSYQGLGVYGPHRGMVVTPGPQGSIGAYGNGHVVTVTPGYQGPSQNYGSTVYQPIYPGYHVGQGQVVVPYGGGVTIYNNNVGVAVPSPSYRYP
ncbi:MAG: hypothetical protein K1X44_00405 [Alphaproteobacteria bacterium]|nr:hypothetical protein [Alphaproteobacteria bacterium]